MNTKVALISFGCAKNLVDSEVMLGLMRRAGFEFVDRAEAADVVVVNTCGFIRPARREAEAAIRSALRDKAARPGRRLIVTGCYVQRDREALSRAFPGVDAWLDVGQFEDIVAAVRGEAVRPSSGTFLYSHLSPRIVSTPRSWAYVKISEGCSHRCAFCSIPVIKGPYRSRPVASIVSEARALAQQGVKEIDIVSQDTTYYGRDNGLKDGLTGLVRELVGVRGLSWIRLLYGYPEEVRPALLEVMKEAKVCPYLDLPFQHADARLLKMMGRGLDGPRALRLIERLRAALPTVALRTSLIVGFPGEGPAEFKRLEGFVREAAFDHLGVFVYSPEEGTPAWALGDPVPARIKAERRSRIMALQASISRARNQRYKGRTLEVLLDRPSDRDPGLALGRTRFQAPEVDGIVRVQARGPVAPLLHGIHRVEITASGVYDLRGHVVE